jgi:hypothetical protein
MATTTDTIPVTIACNPDDVIVEFPLRFTLGEWPNAVQHTKIVREPFKAFVDRHNRSQQPCPTSNATS